MHASCFGRFKVGLKDLSLVRSKMSLLSKFQSLPKISWLATLEIAERSQQNLYPRISMTYAFI